MVYGGSRRRSDSAAGPARAARSDPARRGPYFGEAVSVSRAESATLGLKQHHEYFGCGGFSLWWVGAGGGSSSPPPPVEPGDGAVRHTMGRCRRILFALSLSGPTATPRNRSSSSRVSLPVPAPSSTTVPKVKVGDGGDRSRPARPSLLLVVVPVAGRRYGAHTAVVSGRYRAVTGRGRRRRPGASVPGRTVTPGRALLQDDHLTTSEDPSQESPAT